MSIRKGNYTDYWAGEIRLRFEIWWWWLLQFMFSFFFHRCFSSLFIFLTWSNLPAHTGRALSSLINFLSSAPPQNVLLFTPIWFICSLCLLPLSALTSVIRYRIELRSLLINSSLYRSWQPQAEAADFLHDPESQQESLPLLLES